MNTNTTTTTTTSTPRKALNHCDDGLNCETCRAQLRTVDAVRYPWANPKNVEWLRGVVLGRPDIFGRRKQNAETVRVVYVAKAPEAFPHLEIVVVSDESSFTERATNMTGITHVVGVGIVTDSRSREFLADKHAKANAQPRNVLILWGSGALRAYELPEAEGLIGFAPLEIDPAWLTT